LYHLQVLLTLGGMLLNFAPTWTQWAYQVLVAGVLYGMREGMSAAAVPTFLYLFLRKTHSDLRHLSLTQASSSSGCGRLARPRSVPQDSAGAGCTSFLLRGRGADTLYGAHAMPILCMVFTQCAVARDVFLSHVQHPPYEAIVTIFES
jgi:hypothetical protein